MNSTEQVDFEIPESAKDSLLSKLVGQKLMDAFQNTPEISGPGSAYVSAKSFEELGLKRELLIGIADMGFLKPSLIQACTLPLLIGPNPSNVIAQSQNGTGKTACFVLAVLQRINTSSNSCQAVILTPTYELAVQIYEVMKCMSRHMTNLQILMAVKGTATKIRTVTEHIIVGTPGTFLDILQRGKIPNINQIRTFVLDEADVMIDINGHLESIIKIKPFIPQDALNVLFSATYRDEVMLFAKKVIVNPTILHLKPQEMSLENVSQYFIRCNGSNSKYMAMAELYGSLTIGQTIVFCKTRLGANDLCQSLSRDGHRCYVLSGDLPVESRADIINKFKNGDFKVLISTNLSSRGIDVSQVTFVVNFDLPLDNNNLPDYETYLHRIGRSGRFGRKGLAISFIQTDSDLKIIKLLQERFGREIKELDVFNFEILEKINEEHT